MRNDLRTPNVGMAVALCVALTAVWLVALYGTYEESKREKYDVRVSPGAVTYGTHSTATVPMVTVPMRHSSVPMISGGAIRSYAHHGHASMPSAASGSGFKMHTTSSATVHTIGSGGGGGSVGTSGGSSSSSRGISYSGVSVSMPTLALATPTYEDKEASMASVQTSQQAAAPARRMGNIRKTYPGEGEYIGQPSPSGNQYWDGWDWVDYDEGDTKSEGGKDWVYHNGAWEEVANQSQPTSPDPIGDTPWHWMVLLLTIYGITKAFKSKKRNAI